MRRTLALHSASPDDTRRIAAAVAARLRRGDVVALTGELGAGKTCFVQGAAAALGVTQRVTSPSFILRKEYEGRLPVVHLDVYRLETLQEVVDLGWDEALDGEAVTFVEWGDAMTALLPDERLEVDLRADGDGAAIAPGDDGAEPRRVTLRAFGAGWVQRLAGGEDDLGQWAGD